MDADPVCDSEEEVFCGPVTRRELELMKRRRILFRKTEVFDKPVTPKNKKPTDRHADRDSDDDKENEAPLPASLKDCNHIDSEHKTIEKIHPLENVDGNASSKLNKTGGTTAPPPTPEPRNDGERQPLFADNYIEQISQISKRDLSFRFIDDEPHSALEGSVHDADESFENVFSPMSHSQTAARLLDVLDSICETDISSVSCESMREEEMNEVDASMSSPCNRYETESDVNPDDVVEAAVEETCSIIEATANNHLDPVVSIMNENTTEVQFVDEPNHTVTSVKTFKEGEGVASEDVLSLEYSFECNIVADCQEVVESIKDCQDKVRVDVSVVKSSYLVEGDGQTCIETVDNVELSLCASSVTQTLDCGADIDQTCKLREKLFENKEEELVTKEELEQCCERFEFIELAEDQCDEGVHIDDEHVDNNTSVTGRQNCFENISTEPSLNVYCNNDELIHKSSNGLHDLSEMINGRGDFLPQSVTKTARCSLDSLGQMENAESETSVLNIDTSSLSDDQDITDEENVPIAYLNKDTALEREGEISARSVQYVDAPIHSEDCFSDTVSLLVTERPSFVNFRKKKYSTFFRSSDEDDKQQVQANIEGKSLPRCVSNVIDELSTECGGGGDDDDDDDDDEEEDDYDDDDDDGVQNWSENDDCKILASPNLYKLAEMSKKYQHNEDASKSEKENYFLNALHRRYGNAKLTTRMSDLSLKSPSNGQKPSLSCLKDLAEGCLNKEAADENSFSPLQASNKENFIAGNSVVEQEHDLSLSYASEKDALIQTENSARIGHLAEYSMISEPEGDATSENVEGLLQNVKMLSLLDIIPLKSNSDNFSIEDLKDKGSHVYNFQGNISSVSADIDGGFLDGFSEIALQYDKNKLAGMGLENNDCPLLSNACLGDISSVSADEDGGFLSRFTDIALKHAQVQSSTPQKNQFDGSSVSVMSSLKGGKGDVEQDEYNSDHSSSVFNDTLEDMLLLETYGMDYVLGRKDRFSKRNVTNPGKIDSQLHDYRIIEECVPHVESNTFNAGTTQFSETFILPNEEMTDEPEHMHIVRPESLLSVQEKSVQISEATPEPDVKSFIGESKENKSTDHSSFGMSSGSVEWTGHILIPPTPERDHKIKSARPNKYFNNISTGNVEHLVAQEAQSEFAFTKPKSVVLKQTHKITPIKHWIANSKSPGDKLKVNSYESGLMSPVSGKSKVSPKSTPTSVSRIPRRSPVIGSGLKKNPSPVISSGVKKNPSPVKSSGVKKNSYFSKIQSPVGAYIKSLPTPSLVINKNLPVIAASRPVNATGTCESKKKRFFPDIISQNSAMTPGEDKFGVDAENVDTNNVGFVLPKVSYQRAPALKLDTPSKKKMLHLPESMKRLFEAPVTHVYKHEGRVKVSNLEGSKATRAISPQKFAPNLVLTNTSSICLMPSSQDAEISVVVSKEVSRTDTIGH